MDLGPLSAALQRVAVWVVFANVLAQPLGLPVPAVPTLLVAGSLALTAAACNTVKGAGEDVQSVANCTENAINNGQC